MNDFLDGLGSAAVSAAKGAAGGAALGPIGAAAGGLIGLASSLVPHIFGQDATTALSVAAKAITGVDDEASQVQILSTDSTALAAYKVQALKIAADREQAQLDAQSNDIATRLADVADARARDVQVRASEGGRNVRADVMLGLTVAGIVGALAVAILGKLDGNSAIFGLVSGLVGLLSKCYADAFSFEFGSSRGSQSKDGTISDIARNGISMGALPKPIEITSGK